VQLQGAQIQNKYGKKKEKIKYLHKINENKKKSKNFEFKDVSAPLEYDDFFNGFMVNHRYFEKKNQIDDVKVLCIR
jgi:hypothetical protein